MNNSVSKLLFALALTTSSAAFVFSSANAVEGQALTGKSDTDQIVVAKESENTRQIVVQGNDTKTDELEIKPVAKLDSPISQKIVVVDKGEELEKTPPKQEDTVKEVPVDLVEKVDKDPKTVDEDLFAPQVKTKTVKVEMPTIFTERQVTLFKALSKEDQIVLIEGLVKKYGYGTLYPTDVAGYNNDKHGNYHTPRKSHNQYSNSYNNNYQNSNDHGYRYSNQSSYSNSYSNHSNGCAK